MQALDIVLGVVLGAVMGSYLTCATWRIPQRIPITGRSFCPSCGAQLKDRWNIPIFGWLALRGRTGCCQQPLSVRYPLIELTSGGIGAAIGASAGLVLLWAVVLGVIGVSAAVSFATARPR